MFPLQNVSTSSFENWMTHKGELAQLAFMYVVEEIEGRAHSVATLGGSSWAPTSPAGVPPPPLGTNEAAHPCRMGQAPKAHQMDGCTPGGLQLH